MAAWDKHLEQERKESRQDVREVTQDVQARLDRLRRQSREFEGVYNTPFPSFNVGDTAYQFATPIGLRTFVYSLRAALYKYDQFMWKKPRSVQKQYPIESLLFKVEVSPNRNINVPGADAREVYERAKAIWQDVKDGKIDFGPIEEPEQYHGPKVRETAKDKFNALFSKIEKGWGLYVDLFVVYPERQQGCRARGSAGLMLWCII